MDIEPIIKEILGSQPDEVEYIKRLIEVANELIPLLKNISFCHSGSFISKGKVYNTDIFLILVYEFYLLSNKFNSLESSSIEVYLNFHSERIKKLAADGRLEHLIDVMS